MRSAQASVVEIEKGKRYRVFVEAGRDPLTGKRKRISRQIRGSRKDAERLRVQLLAEIGEPDVAARPMTLHAFWESVYLPSCKERLRPNTVEGYEKDYGQLVLPHLGGMKLSDVTPIAVERMLFKLKESRRFPAYKILRQILSKAVKVGAVATNACKAVDVPKRSAYRPVTLTAKQAAAYISHFRGTESEKAVLLALGGGFRRSELCALEWGDLADDGTVSVTHALTVAYNVPHDDAPKTPFSERKVHLPSGISRRLNELRPESNEGTIVSSDGLPVHPEAVSKKYRAEQKGLPEGVPRIPLKDLRHTSLTLTLESGADILAVSRRAGHANISITSAYYLRPHEHVDVSAAEGLDSALFG